MPLKGKPAAEDGASRKAAETFAKLEKDFKNLPKATEPISCRVPLGERERLRILFAREGLTLAQGIKAAVYKYAKELEAGK